MTDFELQENREKLLKAAFKNIKDAKGNIKLAEELHEHLGFEVSRFIQTMPDSIINNIINNGDSENTKACLFAYFMTMLVYLERNDLINY